MRTPFLTVFLITLGVYFAPAPVHAAFRTFTDPQGREISAEVMSYDGQTAKIRRADGQVFTLSRDRFSEADQAFLDAAKMALDARALGLPVTLDERIIPGQKLLLKFPDLPPMRDGHPAACEVHKWVKL